MKISEKDFKKIMANPLFSGVNVSLAAELFDETGCKVAGFFDRDTILSPQSNTEMAGILLSGRAEITTPDPEHSTLLRYLAANEPFGIANLFSNEPFVSIIQAHGACRVFLMPETAIQKLLEQDHVFLYNYLGFLSGRIHYLNRKIGYLTAGSAERRLALYLASFGTKSVRLTVSISALSDLLNVGRASLYRAFDRLTEDGFICKEGRFFTLLDPDGMRQAYP